MATYVTRRFGANLRQLRKRAGISQEELGFRASLHRTEVGELERGARMPHLDTILKLAGALSVPSSDLIDGLVWVPTELGPPDHTADG